MSATFSTRVRAAALLSTVSILSMTAGSAFAAPTTVTNNPASATNLPAPNTTGGVGAVTMSGTTFTNQGMVGASRYTATGRDFNNDTLGSFSGMTFLRDTWHIDPVTGQYAGGMLTLPDRGPNFNGLFSNYNGRLNGWNFTFSPYAGPNLPQATTSQSQMSLAPNGGFFFSDFNGNAFTGLEPGSNTFVQNGFTFGGPLAGIGAGKISFDPEAVALARDGTYWVSDEYQAGIFHFNSTGRLIGYIPPTAAVTPRIAGVVDFNTVTVNQTGRRANQGLEGLTLTPDGKTLWVMVQSALMQDSTVNNDALRDVTRLIGYDISTGTPTAPIAEYVMELPVFNRGNTNGTVTAAAASNRTAAQSEILALNGTQFLVLSRDGNGLGNDPTVAVGNDGRPPVFKSVLLIDTAGATNINGTTRQTTAGGAVTSAPGVIDPALVPVQQMQLVNLINSAELTRFGMSLATGLGTNLTTISEKWEAMGLLPTLEESKPQDVFLFVGNDNDFLTTNGQINAGITDGVTTTTTYNSGFVNDNMFMVYRLTLPTYVDPLYLEAMQETAPVVMASNAESVGLSGRQGGRAIDSHLDASRQGGVLPKPGSHSAWLVGSYEDIDPVIGGSAYLAQALNGTAGLETGVSERATVGIAVTASDANVKLNGGFGHDVKAVGGSVYAAYAGDNLFGQISYGYTQQSLDDISRPAAYGLVPKGQTDGRTHAVSAKAGYMYNTEDLRIGPVASVSWLSGSIDGYTEAGGAGGNVTYPKFSFDRTDFSAGFEATVQAMLLPTFHAYYTSTSGDDAKSALVSLASAQNIMGTQAISVPGTGGDVVTVGFGVQGAGSVVRWHMGYDADIGVGDSSDDLTHRVTAGVSFLF